MTQDESLLVLNEIDQVKFFYSLKIVCVEFDIL